MHYRSSHNRTAGKGSEAGSARKKPDIPTELCKLSEIFPTISVEELKIALAESQGDILLAIHRISNGHFQTWSEQGKKSLKTSRKDPSVHIAQVHWRDSERVVRTRNKASTGGTATNIKASGSMYQKPLEASFSETTSTLQGENDPLIYNVTARPEDTILSEKPSSEPSCTILTTTPTTEPYSEPALSASIVAPEPPVVMPKFPSSKIRLSWLEQEAVVILPKRATMRSTSGFKDWNTGIIGEELGTQDMQYVNNAYTQPHEAFVSNGNAQDIWKANEIIFNYSLRGARQRDSQSTSIIPFDPYVEYGVHSWPDSESRHNNNRYMRDENNITSTALHGEKIPSATNLGHSLPTHVPFHDQDGYLLKFHNPQGVEFEGNADASGYKGSLGTRWIQKNKNFRPDINGLYGYDLYRSRPAWLPNSREGSDLFHFERSEYTNHGEVCQRSHLETPSRR